MKVQVILDKSNETEKYSAADFLAHAGAPVLIDDKHEIAHNKIMIIDGETVIVSLADALVGVMKESRAPITAPAAAEAVKKAGYKSKAAKFRKIVALTLAKDKKRFKRVSRGKYTLA